MNIYNYDQATGILLNVSEADESPLEEGVYLVPANATDVAPPEFNEKEQIAVWTGKDWSIHPMPVVPEPEPIEPYVPDPQQEINEKSRSYLRDTDWYVIRFLETGVAVPAEITEARNAARAAVKE